MPQTVLGRVSNQSIGTPGAGLWIVAMRSGLTIARAPEPTDRDGRFRFEVDEVAPEPSSRTEVIALVLKVWESEGKEVAVIYGGTLVLDPGQRQMEVEIVVDRAKDTPASESVASLE